MRFFQSPCSGHYYDPLSPSDIISLICTVYGVVNHPTTIAALFDRNYQRYQQHTTSHMPESDPEL